MTRAQALARARDSLATYRRYPRRWCRAKGHLASYSGRRLWARRRCRRCRRMVRAWSLPGRLFKIFGRRFFEKLAHEPSPFLRHLNNLGIVT